MCCSATQTPLRYDLQPISKTLIASNVPRKPVTNLTKPLPHPLPLGEALLVVFGVVLIWLATHLSNHWLLSVYSESTYIYWVYLPAGVRILAILLFGKLGFIGLFLGAVISNIALHGRDWDEVLILSLLSALAPLLAVTTVFKLLRLPASLMGIRPVHLLAFAIAGALVNSLLHTAYLTFTKQMAVVTDGLLPMMVGDLIGTLLVLSLLALALKRWRMWTQ